MCLNEEVIKIFIEGWLVKDRGFSLVNNKVEKNSGKFNILFQLLNSRLELIDSVGEKVIISIEIPKDIDSENCIRFAMQSYLKIVQLIEKERL